MRTRSNNQSGRPIIKVVNNPTPENCLLPIDFFDVSNASKNGIIERSFEFLIPKKKSLLWLFYCFIAIIELKYYLKKVNYENFTQPFQIENGIQFKSIKIKKNTGIFIA